jgi:N-acyl-phosphatidylethanolamine-hydrolysing phospholipase D
MAYKLLSLRRVGVSNPWFGAKTKDLKTFVAWQAGDPSTVIHKQTPTGQASLMPSKLMQEALMLSVKFSGLALMLALTGCSTVNQHFDPSKPHHRPDGFVNNYAEQINKSLKDLLTWFYAQKRDGLPKPPGAVYASYDAFPVVKPDLQYLAKNRTENAVTWIGHATSLVQSGGLNVMVDPVFSERASPVQFAGPQRKVRVPATLAELPHIDVVVISHNHFDHLDSDSIHQLNRQEGGPPKFLVPLGVDTWMRAQGVTTAQALDWWDTVKVGTLEFHFVPAQHWSKRTPFDRNATLWGGWVVRSPSWSFYFTGDTGYSKDFADIGKKFGGFDVSAIAVVTCPQSPYQSIFQKPGVSRLTDPRFSLLGLPSIAS